MSFPTKNFLFIINLVMILCAGCRCLRTGISSTQSITDLYRLYLSDFQKTQTVDFSFLKNDSLRIRITEYYLPSSDTALRGPVKAEIEIQYGVVTKIDSSSVITENVEELSEIIENIATETHDEVKIRGSPFYASWQVKVVIGIIAVIVIYYLLRRAKFL